jgi:hypothetical protein
MTVVVPLPFGGGATVNADEVAVPERLTVCADPDALEVMDREALALPALCEEKVTFTWHDALTARVAVHVLAVENFDESGPVIAMASPVMSDCPAFCSVTACAAEAVLIVCEAKVREPGVSVSSAAGGTVPPVMAKLRSAERPPPGPGDATETWAVPAAAMSDA